MIPSGGTETDTAQAAARQILLVCAQSQPKSAGPLRSLIQQGVDWPYLLDLAARHKLLPLAYVRLRQDAGD